MHYYWRFFLHPACCLDNFNLFFHQRISFVLGLYVVLDISSHTLYHEKIKDSLMNHTRKLYNVFVSSLSFLGYLNCKIFNLPKFCFHRQFCHCVFFFLLRIENINQKNRKGPQEYKRNNDPPWTCFKVLLIAFSCFFCRLRRRFIRQPKNYIFNPKRILLVCGDKMNWKYFLRSCPFLYHCLMHVWSNNLRA